MREGDDPVGAGDIPRFALFAAAETASAPVMARHRDLLEPRSRAPFGENGIWLVRRDGYVAMVAQRGNRGEVDDYLDRAAGRAPGTATSGVAW